MPIIPCTMEARKLLYTAMAVAPMVLMTGIGVHARTYSDPFEFPFTADDHARISAYVPYLVEATEKGWKRAPGAEDRARHLARYLIDGKSSGKLKPLVPITADDLNPQGHKRSVYEIATVVARFLIVKADQHIIAGNYAEAATNLALASDSLSPLKYSDFTTLYRSTLQQGHILHRFKEIYPETDVTTQQNIAACMERMKGDRKQFVRIAKTAKRVILECFVTKKTMEEAVETASSLVPEPNFFEHPALAKEKSAETLVYDPSLPVPNQRLEARQCVMADDKNRAMIDEIMTLSKTVSF